MTTEELEQEAREGYMRARPESTVDTFVKNPLEMLVLTVLAILLMLATRS